MVAEHKDTGEIAGAALTLPDFNQVLGKLNGRLLPFGWITALRAKKHPAEGRRDGLDTGDQSADEPRDGRHGRRDQAPLPRL
jgi:hypothetical protein